MYFLHHTHAYDADVTVDVFVLTEKKSENLNSMVHIRIFMLMRWCADEWNGRGNGLRSVRLSPCVNHLRLCL